MSIVENNLQFNQPTKAVFWMVWGSLSAAVVAYRFFLYNENPEPVLPAVMLAPMLFVPVIIAAACRWFFIPRLKQMQQILVASIIGIAMGESISFYGYFLFPPYQDLFFVVSLLMVLQYMPTYLNTPPAVKDLSAAQS
ncbi:hypothetical protein [Cerasicoccus fimbriatus]|uniref:hypothetical protein n=1 Tax=Cerasicoccus fimbriatus TaxID=3014554 RepID=UPI0022B348AA|nr:hypothetical protein [Cerasicoccus sp. TK19100]